MAAPPTKIQQISLPDLTINYNFKEVPRYDRCTTCHQGIDQIGYDKDASGKPMPEVFASHPFLTSGATAVDPQGEGGDRRALSRRQRPASDQRFRLHHLPRRPGLGHRFHVCLAHAGRLVEQAEDWKERVRLAGDPSLGLSRCCRKRFIESSCVKCHHQVTDIPQAKKLQAGYQRIVKYGCTGCHTIGGEGSFGPDLTDERHGRPQSQPCRIQGHEGLGTQVDQEPARLPARFADAAVLRFDQQRQQGRPAQEPRRDPCDRPLPVRQEHAA